MLEDAQVQALDILEIIDHPDAGRVRVVRPPGDFSATPLPSPGRSPRLGEQTDELLLSLGLSSADVATLRDSGAVA